MNASRSRRGAAKTNEVTNTNATEAIEVKTKETRGRRAKAVSPPPTERPTRATRSSTRVTRKSVIEEVPEEKPTKPEVKPTRGRRGRPATSKQTENSTESETEKQPEPPKRGSRRKVVEPVEEKPLKETKAEKAKPVKPATATTVTTAATTTTTTNVSNATTTTSTTAKSTRGRGTKRSAAVAAAVAIDQSETADEEEAPKPKRATRARTSTTTKEKHASRPARAGTRTSTRGRKKEATPEPEPESAPVTDKKESEQALEKPKDEPVTSQLALEKIEEETDSMVADEKINRDPEILPTVVDVIEGIKEQVERTMEEIKESDLNDTVPDTGTDNTEEKESATDDASSVAETRDSLDVNLDNNSIRDIPDDELKSVDDKSNDDKSSDDKSVDEKPSDETLANEISNSDTENDKTADLDASKDQIVPNAFIENGEFCKAAGDSNDKSLNDTEDDIGLDETLPMETLNDKNGEITKRKTDDLEEDEEAEADIFAIAKQKQVKKARTHLLDIPAIPSVTGKVMTFGDDMCGELGLKETGMSKKRPVFVTDVDEPVVHIASGGMHNVCLTSNGQVYTWGCNDEGALGRKTTDTDDRDLSAEPTKVPLPYKIVKVSAGDSHSAALTSTGSIYIWGNFKDSNGKIGLICDSKEGQIQPIQIDISNTTFVDLASGNDHLLMLTDTGEIYSIGVGEQGQLGRIPAEEMKEIKEKKELFLKPSLVKFDESTICDRIWAGQYSSFARTKTGDIFAWGLNNYSQLGIPQSSLSNDVKADLTVPFPMRVPSFAKLNGLVEQICPGQHFMLARDSKGHVYSCGRHEYGRLGHGKQDESYDEPKLIESFGKELIKQIAAGSVTSFAVSEKGDLYAWGMSGTALGLGDEDAWIPTRVTAKSLEGNKVISVAAGSQHTAIIVQPKNE